MSRSISYHNVTGIDVLPIKSLINSTDGKPFYARQLIITMADGTQEELGLFSDDGYKLLVVDADLDSLTTELPLLKAA